MATHSTKTGNIVTIIMLPAVHGNVIPANTRTYVFIIFRNEIMIIIIQIMNHDPNKPTLWGYLHPTLYRAMHVLCGTL